MGLGVFLALVGFNQCGLGSGGESKPMPRCNTTRDRRVHGHRNGPAALSHVLLPHPGHPRRVRVPVGHAGGGCDDRRRSGQEARQGLQEEDPPQFKCGSNDFYLDPLI